MAAKPGFFQKYRLVFQSSPLILKFILLITILVAIVSLAVLGNQIANIKDQTEEIRQYAAQLEQQNAQLKDRIENPTVENVTEIAGEELGMVDKNATMIPANPKAPEEKVSPAKQNVGLIITITIAAASLLMLGGYVAILRARAKNLTQE